MLHKDDTTLLNIIEEMLGFEIDDTTISLLGDCQADSIGYLRAMKDGDFRNFSVIIDGEVTASVTVIKDDDGCSINVKKINNER